MKKTQQFREISMVDLENKVISLQENLFKLYCNHVVGKVANTASIRNARREIARAKTVLTERTKPSIPQ